MALEETTPKTKAILTAFIMVFNIFAASFINDFWFFIVIMGSSTCPFLAFVMPANIYAKILQKKNLPAWAPLTLKYFGLAMIITYSSAALFAWHIRIYIRSD